MTVIGTLAISIPREDIPTDPYRLAISLTRTSIKEYLYKGGKESVHKLLTLGVRAGGRKDCWALVFRGDEEDHAVFRVHIDFGGAPRITSLRTLIASAEFEGLDRRITRIERLNRRGNAR
jgi:hypothetical protein